MATKKARGIQITNELLLCMLKELENKFLNEFETDGSQFTVFQLYGFGNYDESAPNLKKYIHKITGNLINGKYLYNKTRQLETGEKKVIQVRRDYFLILLNAMGYTDRNHYMQTSLFVTDEQKQIEQNTFSPSLKLDTQYYVGYYLENNTHFVKSKFTIFEGKTAQWDIYYWELNESSSTYVYSYSGKVVSNGENALSFYFPKENSNVQKECFVNVFYGNLMHIKPILLGCYCGFDRNSHPVTGKVIFERAGSPEEQEVHVLEKKEIPVFYQYLYNQRITSGGILPFSVQELEQSPNYNELIDFLIGDYYGFYLNKNGLLTSTTFSLKDALGKSLLKISNSSFNGLVRLLNNDSLLSFEISNLETDMYCSFSLQVNPVEPNLFLGFILCNVGMNLHCGRVLLWKQNEHVKTLCESQHAFTLSDTKIDNVYANKINEYLASKRQLKKDDGLLNKEWLPISFHGSYQLKISLAKKTHTGILKLHKLFEFIATGFSLKGKAFFINGNINLQIEAYNDYAMAGTIIIFIGNLSKKEIKNKVGIYAGLDENNRPIQGTVLLSIKTKN